MNIETIIINTMMFMEPIDLLSSTRVSKMFYKLSKYDKIWENLVHQYYPNSTLQMDNYLDIFKEEYRRSKILEKAINSGIPGLTSIAYKYLYSCNELELDKILQNIDKTHIVSLYDINDIVNLDFYSIEYLYPESTINDINMNIDLTLLNDKNQSENYINNLISKYPATIYTKNNNFLYNKNPDILFLLRLICIDNDIDVMYIDSIPHNISSNMLTK